MVLWLASNAKGIIYVLGEYDVDTGQWELTQKPETVVEGDKALRMRMNLSTLLTDCGVGVTKAKQKHAKIWVLASHIQWPFIHQQVHWEQCGVREDPDVLPKFVPEDNSDTQSINCTSTGSLAHEIQTRAATVYCPCASRGML